MSSYIEAPRILIVDDDASSRVAVRSILEGMDLEVVEAETGEIALRHILRQEFSVIVLDVRLPGIDGFETARAIREREKSREIPIIFLTGIEDDQIQVNRGYQLDAVDYMFKPINVESFRAKIRFIIEYRRELFIALAKERAAREKLSQLIDELERSNRELDDFAYTASHDLKEPLRGIAINAEFLGRERLSAKGKKRVARMVTLTERMDKLVSDLLYFSRLGRGPHVMTDVDTTHIVEGTIKELADWLTEMQATVQFETELPWVSAERSKVRAVFHNLIVNGVKYNDAPERRITIGFNQTKEVEGETISDVFWVRDNGIGIAEKNREKIFRIFQRLNREEEYGSGTGAGLSFVRKIAEEYGGTCTFASDPGKGTTFYVQLPLSQKHEVETLASQE